MAKRKAPKRANGEGSIYQRGDGKWVGSVSIYVEGKGIKRKVFYGKSKTEVREKVQAALAEQKQGMLVASDRQTLAEYLKQWLEDTVKLTRRPRTYEKYESVVRLHIIPLLGTIKLQALTPQHVKKLQAQKLKEGFSPTSVSTIQVVLHKALSDAVKMGMVARNVCDVVSPPPEQHKEMKPLTATQARKLLEAAKGHPNEALFVLALATGMRRGELLGLKWSDIDLTVGMLQVRRTLSRLPTEMAHDQGDLYVEAEPKTKKSKRSIILAGFAVKALEQHRERQLKLQHETGEFWEDHDYVFCDEWGRHLNPGYDALVQLKVLLKKAGLPDIRFHDLRHSAATLLLSVGIHPKVVQEILGHSEISMTMDTYSHVLPTMQEDAMKRLHQAFAEQTDDKPEDKKAKDDEIGGDESEKKEA